MRFCSGACAVLLVSLLSCAADDDGAGDTDADTDTGGTAAQLCAPTQNTEIYERRIAPLLTDARPSTCNECHLKGVDLSLYVQSDPCRTMACMVDEGIVDLGAPADSVVLSWILRAEPAGLITPEVIATEYDGVLEWIEFMAQCNADMCPEYRRPCGGAPSEDDCDLRQPRGPGEVEDPGDCSDLTIEMLWREKVYAWRTRCYPCHFDTFEPDDSELDAPAWVSTGECEVGSLRSLYNAEAFGMLNVNDPMQSKLLTKPLDEAIGGVEHGGDAKIHTVEEGAYIDFVSFLERYAECRG